LDFFDISTTLRHFGIKTRGFWVVKDGWVVIRAWVGILVGLLRCGGALPIWGWVIIRAIRESPLHLGVSYNRAIRESPLHLGVGVFRAWVVIGGWGIVLTK